MTPKKLFLATSAGLVLGIGLIGYGLFWGDSVLNMRADEISQLKADQEDLDVRIENAKNLRDQLSEFDDISSLTKEVLPDTKTQENIVGELISIAANRGISLESINFVGGAGESNNVELSQAEAVEGIPGVFSIQISTSLSTSYANILNILEDIEGNKRRFEVTDISISPTASEDGITNFSASLQIVTYIKP